MFAPLNELIKCSDPLIKVALHWLSTIGGLDWWTGLVDWTTELTDFHSKHAGMIHNVAKSTTGQRWIGASITPLDLKLLAKPTARV